MVTTRTDAVADRPTRDLIGCSRSEPWEPFSEGGCVNERFVALVQKPQPFTLIAYTRAWSSGTKRPVIADAVHVVVATEVDLDKYGGTLADKFVLTEAARDVPPRFSPLAKRFTDDELA